MNDAFPPETYLSEPRRRHHRQAFWQIYLPLAVGMAVFLTLGIMVVVSQETGNPELGRWAAIAAIWIILPLLAAGIVIFLFNLLFIFLFHKANSALPDYGRLARFYFYQAAARVQSLANRLSEPAISAQAAVSGWVKGINSLRRK